MLLGLQSNALKFTREGRVKIYVRILESNLVNTDHKIEISVEDTGIGISE